MKKLDTSPNMRDKSPLFQNQTDKQAATKIIEQINQSMGLFKAFINLEPTKSDAFIHLSLLENYLAKLSKLTGYDGMIAKEQEQKYAEIRAANLKIHELESLLGSQVSANAVAAGMQHWENVFRAWYEASGFHYADIKMNPYVIRADFSDELTNEPKTRRLATKEILEKITGHVHFITDDSSWDIEHDRFHSNLLDTNKNKQNIIQLFTRTFPNSTIHEFKAHKDSEKYYLSFDAVIPWDDLDKYWSSIK